MESNETLLIAGEPGRTTLAWRESTYGPMVLHQGQAESGSSG